MTTDGQGCLRDSNKPGQVKSPDIIDISWPHCGRPSDLVTSMEERLNNYPDASKESLVFDKNEDISAKDHERMRRAGDTFIDYDLSITRHLDRCNYEK